MLGDPYRRSSGTAKIKIYSISDNNTNYIIVKCKNSKQNLKFLIDTGADISICKLENIAQDTIIDINKKCKLTGITKQETLTLGSVQLQLDFQCDVVKHSFHAVEQDFPIDTDGIIGRDFLTRYMCKIDYETQTLTVILDNTEVVTPLYINKNAFNIIRIPPRTEIITPINLNLDQDSVILNEEIQTGVFIANSIVPSKGICHLKILNTTETEIIINKVKPKLIPLSNYFYFKQDRHTYK